MGIRAPVVLLVSAVMKRSELNISVQAMRALLKTILQLLQ